MYCIVLYSEVEKKDSEIKEKETPKEKEKEKPKDKEKEKGRGKTKAPKQLDESKLTAERSIPQKQEGKQETDHQDEIKELLINPNCLTRILLDYVSEQLGLGKDAEIDFCDEFGQLARIGSLKNWEYATEALKPQTTYVVIAFQRAKSGKYRSIRPILTKYCRLYGEIVDHLRAQFSSSSIYISDKCSSKSFARSKAESRGSMKSIDKYHRIGSEQSKSSDRLRKVTRKGSHGSYAQFGRKSSSRHTLRSLRGSTKSAQAVLGMDSEVEIKPKRLQSKENKEKNKQTKKSPK